MWITKKVQGEAYTSVQLSQQESLCRAAWQQNDSIYYSLIYWLLTM